jgi:hypothetical protein
MFFRLGRAHYLQESPPLIHIVMHCMLTPNSRVCLAFSLVLKSANLDSHQCQSSFFTFLYQHAIFFWIQLAKSSWRVARSQASETRSAGLPGVQDITGGCSPRSANLIVVVISPDTAFVSKLAAEQQKGNFLHPRSVMVLYSRRTGLEPCFMGLTAWRRTLVSVRCFI